LKHRSAQHGLTLLGYCLMNNHVHLIAAPLRANSLALVLGRTDNDYTRWVPVRRSTTEVPHSRIRELAEIAMSMDGVLKLYFGESNVPTPEYIERAAYKAMADGYTFYTENAGLPSLRQKLAEHYQQLHGVALDPGSEIVITASGVQALNVGIRCALDPGDEALVLTPAWPNGSANVALAWIPTQGF